MPRFFLDDHGREVIEIENPHNHDKAVRVATDADRQAHSADYAAFKNPPQTDESKRAEFEEFRRADEAQQRTHQHFNQRRTELQRDLDVARRDGKAEDEKRAEEALRLLNERHAAVSAGRQPPGEEARQASSDEEPSPPAETTHRRRAEAGRDAHRAPETSPPQTRA
jgi:hypothetical protein